MGLLNNDIKDLFVVIAGPQMNKNRDEVLEIVDVLDKLLELDNPPVKQNDSSFDKDYVNQILNDFPQKVYTADSDEYINYIEGMLKKIIMIIDPVSWNSKWQEYEDAVAAGDTHRKEPWQLASLYKKIGVLNVPWDVEDTSIYRSYGDYLEQYARVYKCRNKGGHGNNAKVFDALFVVYLHVCEKYADKIIEAHTFQKVLKDIKVEDYCNRVIDAYKKEKLDEMYEIAKWKVPEFPDANTENIEEVLKDKVAKLIGGPGVGKSTALQYCRYRACQRTLDNNEFKIPILIDLWRAQDKSLDELIAEELNISSSNVPQVLEKNVVSLYLDGYNEIIEEEAKTNVSKRIDEMISQYPFLTILVTDRAKYSHPQIAIDAIVCNLKPLDDAQTARLIRKTAVKLCEEKKKPSEDIVKLLVTEVENEDGEIVETYTDEVRAVREGIKKQWTPYHAVVIAKYAAYKGRVIDKDDFWRNYLDEVIIRESADKKEHRITTLVDMLTRIARKDNGANMSRMDVLDLLEASNKSIDWAAYLQLAQDMRLYIAEDDGLQGYKFFNAEIRDYFYKQQFHYGALSGNSDEEDDDDVLD